MVRYMVGLIRCKCFVNLVFGTCNFGDLCI